MNPALRLLAVAASGGSTILPSAITGLAQWTKAADAADFSFSSSNVISQWNDKSGNARHWTQGTVANQPTRQTAVLNGKAVVRFDGINDQLDVANYASGFTAGELFVIIKDVDETGQYGFHKGFTADTLSQHYPFNDGNVYEPFGTDTRKSTGNPTPSLASWNLYNVRSASGAYSTYLNGTLHYTTATNTVGFGSNTHTLGVNQAANFAAVDVAEWIVYNNIIGTSDRTGLHAYLESEYGLTIA